VRRRTWALAGGLLLGLVAGRTVRSRQRRRFERELYHATPQVRQAALTWMAQHPGAATLATLRAWLAWEPIPSLQRRGTVILGRMAAAMGQGDAA